MSYIRSTVSPEGLDISDNSSVVTFHCGETNKSFQSSSNDFKNFLIQSKKKLKKTGQVYWSNFNFFAREICINVKTNEEVDINNIANKEIAYFEKDKGWTLLYREVVRLSYFENYVDMYLSTWYYIVFANKLKK
jgi:hypothetical protein